jgi:hypothetical protein
MKKKKKKDYIDEIIDYDEEDEENRDYNSEEDFVNVDEKEYAKNSDDTYKKKDYKEE